MEVLFLTQPLTRIVSQKTKRFDASLGLVTVGIEQSYLRRPRGVAFGSRTVWLVNKSAGPATPFKTVRV